MTKPVEDKDLQIDEREFIKGKPLPMPLVVCLQVIAVSFFAAPRIMRGIEMAKHDVPEGYEFLSKSDEGVFYYAKLGGKFESVQVMNMHSIDSDKKAEAFPVPVDCATKEAGGIKPKHGTVGHKIVARACGSW